MTSLKFFQHTVLVVCLLLLLLFLVCRYLKFV